jgi:7-cyano-7-deazaguanine synthase
MGSKAAPSQDPGGEARRLKCVVANASTHRPAVVLLSGGLDSATVLAVARAEGYRCYAISFDYGQRHRVELEAARRVAAQVGGVGAAEHKVVHLDLRAIGGSALTDEIEVPRPDEARVGSGGGGGGEGGPRPIPITYVPARNMVFLSIAAGYAEVVGASDIFIGVNSVDYSGYPDCRPEFLRSFEETVNLGTKAGTEGARLAIHAPLSTMSKAAIIRLGAGLDVDYSLTVSCYDPTPEGAACSACESCILRRRGFEEAGVEDPTRYGGRGETVRR